MPQAAKAPAKRVLLVENEPLLNFLRTVLEREGFQVFSADCAEEAIRIAAACQTPIDLLLTGCWMPGLSGPKLAEQLEGRPGLQVILMSSQQAPGTIAQNHGWRFIQKPFSPSTLIGTVKSVFSAGTEPAGDTNQSGANQPRAAKL